MIVYRHTDPRFPFLWESGGQPAGRWNAEGEGPVNTFADRPEGAWAELLRHEEITDPRDVAEIRRSLWAVDVGDLPTARPRLPRVTMTGGPRSYVACRREASRLRGAASAGSRRRRPRWCAAAPTGGGSPAVCIPDPGATAW